MMRFLLSRSGKTQGEKKTGEGEGEDSHATLVLIYVFPIRVLQFFLLRGFTAVSGPLVSLLRFFVYSLSS